MLFLQINFSVSIYHENKIRFQSVCQIRFVRFILKAFIGRIVLWSVYKQLNELGTVYDRKQCFVYTYPVWSAPKVRWTKRKTRLERRISGQASGRRERSKRAKRSVRNGRHQPVQIIGRRAVTITSYGAHRATTTARAHLGTALFSRDHPRNQYRTPNDRRIC